VGKLGHDPLESLSFYDTVRVRVRVRVRARVRARARVRVRVRAWPPSPL